MGTGRGGRCNAWTPDERRRLLIQHNSGVAISNLSLPGRTQKACVQEYYRLKDPEKRLAHTARRRMQEAPAIAPTRAEAARLAAEPGKRPRYFHEADLDIISRIERQGLTAGFLGDPPAGRSALDRKEGRA